MSDTYNINIGVGREALDVLSAKLDNLGTLIMATKEEVLADIAELNATIEQEKSLLQILLKR